MPAWFQKHSLDDIKPTILASLRASLTLSLGSLALNAMLLDIVNAAIWFLEVLIGSSALCSGPCTQQLMLTSLVPGLNYLVATVVGRLEAGV